MALAIVVDNTKKKSDLFKKDVWKFEELGVKTSITKSEYQINFSLISQYWLKNATKKFINLMALTRSHGTLIEYVASLKYLSKTLKNHSHSNSEKDISRELILCYMTDLKKAGLSNATRKKRILNIKLFIELATRESWLNIENSNIIYSEDMPRVPKPLPRFIPESVMTQLNQHINLFEPSVMRLLLVLQECGMRISELLTLKWNCLIADNDGDYFLYTNQAKMNKEHTIPITVETYNVFKEQMEYVISIYGNSCEWLFPMELKSSSNKKNLRAGMPYKTRTIIEQINRVADKAKIIGDNGKIFHFTTHMFRHTVGTRMINNGVPQHIIQRYLGHETPTMTSTYAHIMDSTMKREFIKFKGVMVDVAGNIVDSESIARDISLGADNVDAQWLKRHISAQALPNGLCAMPVVQTCDKANACLTCGNFRTDSRYLDQHKEQLERTCSILDTAKQKGWTRQIEMTEKLKQNLIKIIEPLEAHNDA